MNIDSSIDILRTRYKDIEKYAEIMSKIQVTDVSVNEDLQRTFNAFYRVRRNALWRKDFYTLFEECKKKKGLSFEFILREMYKRTSRIEASFSSKMLATINPQMPIWDSIVLSKLGIKPRAHYKDRQERLNESIEIYESIVDWYIELVKTSKAQVGLEVFDKAFPEFVWMTSVKKIDFILWGGGGDNPFEVELQGESL